MTSFIRSLLSNLLTLLLSLILAVTIWIRASQGEDPIRNQFMQIPIEFSGQPENGILVSPDNPQNVQILIAGPTSIVNQLSSDDFSAGVDLSQIPFNEDVSVEIQLRAETSGITVLSQIPEQITVHLEQEVSRDIPVVLDIRGSVARGHTQGDPLIDPEHITVRGTASRVQSLDFARVTVFLNNDRETVVDTPQPIFYDRQGRVASVSGLSLSTEQVKVTIPVNETAGFAEKLITVDWVGEPAPGYRLLSVSVTPPSVLVRGLPTQVNSLNRVETEPIDITGLTQSFRQQVALDLPEGITLDEVEEIFVDIEIEPILTTSTYNRVPELQGLGRDMEATVEPEEVRIVLFGPLPVLDALQEEEVRVSIDLFGLEPGTYSLEPDVNFPERGIELRSIQPSLVTVNITDALTITNELTGTQAITNTSLSLLPMRGERTQKNKGVESNTSYICAGLPVFGEDTVVSSVKTLSWPAEMLRRYGSKREQP